MTFEDDSFKKNLTDNTSGICWQTFSFIWLRIIRHKGIQHQESVFHGYLGFLWKLHGGEAESLS